MSLYENLRILSAQIATLSPNLADALAKLPNDGVPSYHEETGEALLVDLINPLTASASRPNHLDPSLKLYEKPMPFGRLVSFLGSTARARFTQTRGRLLPAIIAPQNQRSVLAIFPADEPAT
jgi:hypothetical protein